MTSPAHILSWRLLFQADSVQDEDFLKYFNMICQPCSHHHIVAAVYIHLDANSKKSFCVYEYVQYVNNCMCSIHAAWGSSQNVILLCNPVLYNEE